MRFLLEPGLASATTPPGTPATKEYAHDFLERVAFEVKQHEEKPRPGRGKHTRVAGGTGRTLCALASCSSRQQPAKSPACQRAEKQLPLPTRQTQSTIKSDVQDSSFEPGSSGGYLPSSSLSASLANAISSSWSVMPEAIERNSRNPSSKACCSRAACSIDACVRRTPSSIDIILRLYESGRVRSDI